MEAIALLEEWVQSVGSQAGLTEQNTTIMSGAVGVPESRLEASAAFTFLPHSIKTAGMPTILRTPFQTPSHYNELLLAKLVQHVI